MKQGQLRPIVHYTQNKCSKIKTGKKDGQTDKVSYRACVHGS